MDRYIGCSSVNSLNTPGVSLDMKSECHIRTDGGHTFHNDRKRDHEIPSQHIDRLKFNRFSRPEHRDVQERLYRLVSPLGGSNVVFFFCFHVRMTKFTRVRDMCLIVEITI